MRLTSRGGRRCDVAPTFGEGPRLVPAACGITLEGVNSQVKLREFVSLCLCHLLAVPQFLTCEIKLSRKASVNCPMEGAQNTTRYGSAGTRLLCRGPVAIVLLSQVQQQLLTELRLRPALEPSQTALTRE